MTVSTVGITTKARQFFHAFSLSRTNTIANTFQHKNLRCQFDGAGVHLYLQISLVLVVACDLYFVVVAFVFVIFPSRSFGLLFVSVIFPWISHLILSGVFMIISCVHFIHRQMGHYFEIY